MNISHGLKREIKHRLMDMFKMLSNFPTIKKIPKTVNAKHLHLLFFFLECISMLPVQEFENFVAKRFKEKSWRMTSGVRNISRVLAETRKPLSIADMVATVDSNGKSLDLATGYRIMDRLLETGMAKKVDRKYMPTSDPTNTKEVEHFLICEKSGQAESIFLNYHDAIAKQLKKEKNFNLARTEIVFYGTKDYTG